MLEDKPEKFTYDLTVQLQVQSILSACIFYKIQELIKINSSLDDLKNVPKCVSYLGKNGTAVTYAKLANYFCVDKKRIEYAMNILKDSGLIGMDYVNVEMGREQFIFIEKNGLTFNDLDPRQSRSCNAIISKQTKCFNCAALYSHISYWNEKYRESMIQSMQLISERIGITKDKVKLSILKLTKLNMVHTTASTDQRYSLSIVGHLGLRKVGGGSQQKISTRLEEGLPKFAFASIDSYSENFLQEKQGEKSPPDFFTKNEEKKTAKKKVMHMEISNLDYNELVEIYGETRMLYAITRYNRESQKIGQSLPGDVKMHLLTYLGYSLENQINTEANEKKENPVAQQEADYSAYCMPMHEKIIERKMRSLDVSKALAIILCSIEKVKEDLPNHWREAVPKILKSQGYDILSAEEKQTLHELSDIKDSKVINISKVG